jgi:putative hydrolase of the HAD superfamily
VSRACVVFDFDGTIIDTELPAYRAASELWSTFGFEVTPEEWAWRIGTAGHDDPFTELQRWLGRELDPALDERRVARKNELTDQAPLRPGVQEWLDAAQRLSLPVGIASSSPTTWIERNLGRLRLRERFGCLACCDGELPAKPDPTSYRHAVEQLGAEPAWSVAVEDSEHGVNAAHAAGLFVVAVPHPLTHHMDFSRADLVVESLLEVTLEDALAHARARPHPGSGRT